MKKENLFLMLFALLMNMSCGEKMTEQERIEALVQQQTQSDLKSLEDYEPIETALDSAFAPYDAPKLTKAVCDILENASNGDINSIYEVKMKYAAGLAHIREVSSSRKWNWLDKRDCDLFERQVKEAREMMQDYTNYLKRVDNEMGVSFNQIYGLVPSVDGKVKRRELLGFKAVHRFHCMKDGKTITDSTVYLLNEQKNQIIDNYDSHNNFYTIATDNIEAMKAKRLVIR